MSALQIHNPRFITYTDDVLTIDVLGGVDLLQLERMICTLRITCQQYPPLRTTIDVYNDTHTQKLIRSLCDKWSLTLVDASRSIHRMITELEGYKLERLKYPRTREDVFTPDEEEKKQALDFLKNKDLLTSLTKTLNHTGILGEDENAVILFLALASHKYKNPFSVICLAKPGIGKSYMLQKLSACMPPGSYSFHTKISANALYYFDSSQMNGKALLIEDMDWATQMLSPLSTLQTQGRLVHTRATKDKDGMLHSTTFEVVANLCLVACAYSEHNIEEVSLPFLCLHLNHSHSQDIAVMEYQKKCKAGHIKPGEVSHAQHLLKCIISTLQNVSIVNPYATLIHLPDGVPYPRKSLLLLLNFIEVITYFFQYQREQVVDESTGEVFIQTHPYDIELAYTFLKNNLLRRADELSTPARGFYNWLTSYLKQAKTSQFTTLDIRRIKPIHPRTLSRYLQELVLFSYIQISGGNKYRGGFIYKLTDIDQQGHIKKQIERELQENIKKIWEVYSEQNPPQPPTGKRSKPVRQNPVSNSSTHS